MPKLFIFLAVGTLILYASALVLILGMKVLGALLAVLAALILVAARRRWPADQDYYVDRNYTRRP